MKLLEGLVNELTAVVEERKSGITAKDLREHWPSLYKEYIAVDSGQTVEEYLRDKNMLDSVMMVIEQQEMKEDMGGDDDEEA